MSSSSDKKPGVLGRFLSQRGMGQVITVTIGLIVLCLVFGFINPNFFTYRNTANLLRQIAPTLLIVAEIIQLIPTTEPIERSIFPVNNT